MSRLLLICSFSVFISCENKNPTGVEKINGESALLLPLELHKLKGFRDGYYAYVSAKFIGDGQIASNLESVPDSIVLELSIKIGVPSLLYSGKYIWYENEQIITGPVESSYLHFTGGQGGLPGFGGTYLFKTDAAAYRIKIQPRELSRK